MCCVWQGCRGLHASPHLQALQTHSGLRLLTGFLPSLAVWSLTPLLCCHNLPPSLILPARVWITEFRSTLAWIAETLRSTSTVDYRVAGSGTVKFSDYFRGSPATADPDFVACRPIGDLGRSLAQTPTTGSPDVPKFAGRRCTSVFSDPDSPSRTSGFRRFGSCQCGWSPTPMERIDSLGCTPSNFGAAYSATTNLLST